MELTNKIKALLFSGTFLLLFAVSCDSPKREEIDEEAGTSRAIVGDSSHLNQPRPAPIGDTAVTGEQADQFGDMKANDAPIERGRVE